MLSRISKSMDIINCHMHVFPWIHGIRQGRLETRGERFGYVHACMAEEFPNVRFDIAGLPNATAFMGKGEEEYPYLRMQEVIKVTCEKAGPDTIMWGSYYPSVLVSCTYKQTIKIVTEYCNFLSKREKSKITSENASNFFIFR